MTEQYSRIGCARDSTQANLSWRGRVAFVGALLAIGFFLRIVAAFVWQNSIEGESQFRFGDSDTYWVIANKIGKGLPYQYGSPDSKVFRAPLYPLFLSPCTWLDSETEGANGGTKWKAVFAARIAGCAMGALCIGLVMLLTDRSCRKKDGPYKSSIWIWSGILAVLYPGAIGMSIFVLSEAVFCPLLLLSLGFTSFAIQAKRESRWEIAWSWMLLSGAISGLASLARPSWSLWPAILFLYLAAVLVRSVPRPSMRTIMHWFLGFGMFCLGIGMVMCPWWLRNYQETGKFVPTTLQVGASLYDGWHPGASGSSDEGMDFVNAFIAEQKNEDQRETLAGNQLESTLEWRVDRRLRNAAIAWAVENSSEAVRLGLVKFVKTWSPLPVARELGKGVKWFEAIGYTAIMVFALIGMWQCRTEAGSWLYTVPCVYFALLHVFFIGSVRYRQPAVLVICVLGGIGCAETIRWIQKRKTKLEGSIASNDVTVDTSHK